MPRWSIELIELIKLYHYDRFNELYATCFTHLHFVFVANLLERLMSFIQSFYIPVKVKRETKPIGKIMIVINLPNNFDASIHFVLFCAQQQWGKVKNYGCKPSKLITFNYYLRSLTDTVDIYVEVELVK